MSAIDPAAPASSQNVSLGDNALREERQWLLDLWVAFKVRQVDGTVSNDPGTSTGAFNVPLSAPGTLRVGDFYFTSTGLMYSVKTGPTAQLTGTLPATTKKPFRLSAAPTGWTRDTTTQNGSGLQYTTSSSTAVGGTTDISGSLTHVPTVSMVPDAGTPNFWTQFTAHAIKYLDVILATKD